MIAHSIWNIDLEHLVFHTINIECAREYTHTINKALYLNLLCTGKNSILQWPTITDIITIGIDFHFGVVTHEVNRIRLLRTRRQECQCEHQKHCTDNMLHKSYNAAGFSSLAGSWV